MGDTDATPSALITRFRRIAMFVGLWVAAWLTYAVGITYFPLFDYSDSEAPTLANSLFWGGILGGLIAGLAVLTQWRRNRSSV